MTDPTGDALKAYSTPAAEQKRVEQLTHRLLDVLDNEENLSDEALEAFKALDNALSARTPAPQSDLVGWQPIETAPRDETQVLLYGICRKPSVDAGKTAIVIGYWTNFNTGGWVWYGASMEFTHWQPLPLPPALAAEGRE